MEINRVGVYPYSTEFEPFLRHNSLLDQSFEIRELISPLGWGLVGQTFLLENGKELTVVPEFESVINDIDTVFIPSFQVDDKVETLITKEILAVVPSVKKIICAAKLSSQNTENLKNTCEKADCIFENLNLLKSPEQYGLVHQVEENSSIESIDVPVVMIAGLWEEIDKFEVSLALRKKFVQDGYKVTQIGSRNCCELFGFHSFPGFMLDSCVDATNKIIYFNHWIWQLTKAEKPDIVIVTIPGAIQNLSDRFTKGFGVLPHIVFQAIMADFFIFCTMYDESSIQFLQEISTMCKYKFDCHVDCYHMSNLLFDLNESKVKDRVIVNRVERNDVSCAVGTSFKNSPIPIINVLEKSSQDRLLELVVNRLSGKDVKIIL